MILMTGGRRLVILARLLTVIAVLFLLYISNRKAQKLKKKLAQLTFKDFNLFFENFVKNKLKANFIGLTSNNIDCLYFVTRKNYVNVEFEVLQKAQIPLAKKLVAFAKKKGFKVGKISYKNKMNDDVQKDAPVYQIYCKLNAKEASVFAKEIYTTVFNDTENTPFTMVF